jgi:signal transduction histidine kinase
MVSDLLTSLASAGLARRARPLDLGTVAQEVCEVFRARGAHRATLSLEISPLYRSWWAMKTSCGECFANLVDNAIKYTTRNGRWR